VGKRDFTIDLAAGTVTCPAGHSATIRTMPSGGRHAIFPRSACGACPLRSRCLGPKTTHKKLDILPDEALLLAARQALDDPATAEHLRRTRPRIERLLGLLAGRYGARKARYVGRAKARLQAAWAAALVNLNPIAHRLTAPTA
jgi:DDE family transposase